MNKWSHYFLTYSVIKKGIIIFKINFLCTLNLTKMFYIAGDTTSRAREETNAKELKREEIPRKLAAIEQSKTAQGEIYNF